jgi:heme/copper-type cytochrome/quinol oxidase subunit 2
MSPRALRVGRPATLLASIATLAAVLGTGAAVQTQAPAAERSFTIIASRYSFSPSRLEVAQDDLVRIELHTRDIPHSLTIDDYRIAKRVGPEQPVAFEFRAERPGTFRFYCDLKAEEGCRAMHGELVVRPR